MCPAFETPCCLPSSNLPACDLESRHTCRPQIPVSDGVIVPLDELSVSILRDNNNNSITQFITETIGSTVSGTYLFTEFLLRKSPLHVESVGNGYHFVDVTRNHSAEAEQVLTH